jgi:Zn-dependent protease with chaperone function
MGLLLLGFRAAVAAAEPGDTGLADSVAVDTAVVAPAAVDVEEPTYPMSAERHEQMVAYSQFKNVWRFVNFFVGLVTLSILLVFGLSARFRNWAGKIRLRFFAVWFFFILILLADYILTLPFNVYRNYFVEHSWGFLNQTFLQWWGEDLLGLLIGAIIGIIPVWFFYWLVGRMKRWWLAFSLGAIPFMVFFIVIAPVVISPMFNEFGPLEDKQLESEILALADKADIEGADVFEVNASKQSSKISAYVTGLFGTKRIVLYDTLIRRFSLEEIKFVMGHEMGHYVMHHIWWGLAVVVLFFIGALWLVNRTIHPVINRFKSRFRFDRLSDIASLPLVLIFASVISFVFQPITNGFSRYMERKADAYGMEISGVSGEDAATAFDKLTVYNLSDPDPHPIVEFWFYDHPSLKKRMDFVREWEQ